MSTLWKGGVIKWKEKAGRNNKGRITVRRRGGGVKKKLRQVLWSPIEGSYKIEGIEYDPHRTAELILVKTKIKVEEKIKPKKFFMLAAEGIKEGDKIKVSYKAITIEDQSDIVTGNIFKLSEISVGIKVCNIGGKWIRAGGTTGSIIEKDKTKNRVIIKMPSGEIRWFNGEILGIIGIVRKNKKVGRIIGKAGVSRRLGHRPKVRGVAINPIDHPHGGGEGRTSGGRVSVTPWGKPTKGQKTRKKWKRN